jgi:hypothetical protein
MQRLIETVGVLAGLVVLLAFFGVRPGHVEAKPQAPVIVPVPYTPQPPDTSGRRRPHRDVALGVNESAPDGTQPAIDFPEELWFPNIGSKIDGAGMCVFTAAEFAGVYAGLDEFRGFRDWCASRYPGGGYPEKLLKLTQEYCEKKGIPRERFDPAKDLLQIEHSDPRYIELCVRNGWCCGLSLYHSDRYKDPRTGQVLKIIYHMTNCAHFGDGKWGAVLDNNFRSLEWKPAEKYLADSMYQGRYWLFAFRAVGPPPAPMN